MPAYTNTESRRHTHRHTDTQTDKRRPITQRWVSGPLNSLASRQQAHLTEWHLLFTRLGVTFFSQNQLPPGASAGLGLTPAGTFNPFSLYRKNFLQSRLPPSASAGLGLTPAGSPLQRNLSSVPDTFLLPSRASDLHWTFLFCLSTGVFIYPSPLSWKSSLYPVKGSRTSPQMFCPMCESPSGKREGFRNNATCKKREVYY